MFKKVTLSTFVEFKENLTNQNLLEILKFPMQLNNLNSDFHELKFFFDYPNFSDFCQKNILLVSVSVSYYPINARTVKPVKPIFVYCI